MAGNLVPHIRSEILRQRGGQHNWQVLEEVVAAMTPQQQEAFYRTLQNANDEGRQQGKRDALRSPFRYMGT